MKEYLLKSAQQQNDVAPIFVQRAMTWAKASNEICGLVRGLLADNVINEIEANYLRKWISDHPELLTDSVIAILTQRIEKIFKDGIIIADELKDLQQVLSNFAREDGAATTLPLDTPPPIVVFPNHGFCFTGKFAGGTRSWCESETVLRGGTTHGSPTSKTNYLVIGSAGSEAWVNQTYGRKIQAAVSLKNSGHQIAIVHEETWHKYLSV